MSHSSEPRPHESQPHEPPRRRGGGTRALIAAATLIAPLTVGSAGPVAAKSFAPIAITDRGAVRGTSTAGVESWLGVPYAAAPIGARRWTAPAPAVRWSGLRAATDFGNPCPAQASTNGERSETEDCLFINVQRPKGTRPGDRLPVYVFIHGGGLTNGGSHQMNMDKIVRETGVIGVTMNYRLGIFGFLGHPALTALAGESGNYGFQDQQAALRWVQHNIGAFGGAKGRVTIGGESAGGWSVCGHLAAPGSRGLFSAAMIQSGSCVSQTQAAADTTGTAFAAAVGCPEIGAAPACLRAKPAGMLLDVPGGLSARFVHGAQTLPVAPDTAVRSGRFTRVPVVIGANRDEGRTFSTGMIGWTQEQYTAWIGTTFGGKASAVQQRYPWPATSDRFTAAYLAASVFTDAGLLAGIGGCANLDLTQALAEHTRTYAYEFAHRTGPGLVDLDGYVWGAGHAAELAYLWPSFNNGTPIAPLFDASERRLAKEMVQYWGAFAKNGRPGLAGQTPWPRSGNRGVTLSLRAGGRSTLIRNADFRAEHQCDFWDALPTTTS